MNIIAQNKEIIVLHETSLLMDSFVCKIPLLARRTRPKGRPSAARDDRVSCCMQDTFARATHSAKRARDDWVSCIQGILYQ